MRISGLLLLGLTALIWLVLEYTNTSGWRLIAEAKGEIMQANQPSKRTDGALLHTVGPLKLKDDNSLVDPDVTIKFKGARVRRVVEMYQWEKSSTGNIDSYYSIWSSSAISSYNHSYFYQNPSWDSDLQSKYILNDSPASVNGFHIPTTLLSSLEKGDLVSPQSLVLPRFSEKVSLVVYSDSSYIYLSSKSRAATATFYPEIGDYRVVYYVVPSNVQVAVIGEQQNNDLVSWRGQVLLLSNSILDSDAMLETLSISTYLMWFLRSLFVVLIFTGGWLANSGGRKQFEW
jgi:hypothetical protein